RAAGRELLTRGPELLAWRAPTDNDRISRVAQRWREAGLDRLSHELVAASQVSDGQVSVTVRSAAAGCEVGFESIWHYLLQGDGSLCIEHECRPFGELPPLPRLGLQLRLPGAWRRLSWFGRGPHENYPDRLLAARVGRWESTVDEQYVPYTMPQDHGNHAEVRWFELRDEAGLGLRLTAAPLCHVAALGYTDHELDEAQHDWELRPRKEVVVSVAPRVSGLGNGSCGPGVLPAYQVPAEPCRYRLELRPLVD
ncbi:MAG: beta-galactosidase, partial [Armatimonadetes bacterium]|nr:beta-galactosidase [Armatimonadota bacterium]